MFIMFRTFRFRVSNSFWIIWFLNVSSLLVIVSRFSDFCLLNFFLLPF